MARMARLVVPHYPHHVTQRGNRRQQVFFSTADYRLYRELLAKACREQQTRILAYCLMPNHVHLVMVPDREDGLRAVLGEAHRRYSRHVNRREDWRGHLWQERFYSSVMDERHLLAAVRYVELNPVRAGLCGQACEWPWSSAAAHLDGRDDDLVSVAPMRERISDWEGYLQEDVDTTEGERIRRHARSGRPLGSDEFVAQLERLTRRRLRPARRGRKGSGLERRERELK